MNKKIKNEEKKAWQPDREMVCAALFYEDLLEKYIENKEMWSNFLIFAKN